MQIFQQLWQDERGFTISTELVLVATIAGIGMIVGLASYRDGIVNELADTGVSVSTLNQSYSYTTTLPAMPIGFGDIDGDPGTDDPRVFVTVSVADSSYTDNNDFCDHITPGLEGSSVADPAGAAPACITYGGTTAEGTAFPPTIP